MLWPSAAIVHWLTPTSLWAAADDQSPVTWTLGDALHSFCFLAVTVGVAAIARRSLRDLGLGPAPMRLIVAGFAFGVELVTVFMAAILISGRLNVSLRGESAPDAVGFGAFWLFGEVLVGISEELTDRAAPLFLLVELKGPVVACLVTGFAYGTGHLPNAGENPLGLAGAVIWALAAAGITLRFGTI